MSHSLLESVLELMMVRWYTSLIGKYASLEPLIHHLRAKKVLRAAHVSADSRSIITLSKPSSPHVLYAGSSAGLTRLSAYLMWVIAHRVQLTQQTFTQMSSENTIPVSPKYLPPRNTLSHTPLVSVSPADMKLKILDVLQGAQLDPSANIASATTEGESIMLHPTSVTWSRAARRHAAQTQDGPSAARRISSRAPYRHVTPDADLRRAHEP